MISPEETIENTLCAVRQKKQRRRQQHYMTGAFLLLVAIACLIHFRPQPNPTSVQDDTTEADLPPTTYQVEIARASGTQITNLSSTELSELVYHLGVTFEMTDDGYIWKAPHQYICLTLPSPNMILDEQKLRLSESIVQPF